MDAILTVAPSWAEAVAIVQAVCAQLEPGRMPPAVGDLHIHPGGGVWFPPGGLIDEDVAIQLTARLLGRLVGGQSRPFELDDVIELAHLAPMTFASVRGFGASLTCVPADRGALLLAAYVRDVVGSRPLRRPALPDRAARL